MARIAFRPAGVNIRIWLLFAVLLLTSSWGTPGWAVSPAEDRYAAAIEVEKNGDLDEAESLYRQLAADYPQSIEADHAGRQIDRINLRRKQLHMQQFMPMLHRLRTILLGYRQLTGQFPQKLADFDREDFPFSSEHLARIVPAGFVAYLQLLPDRDDVLICALQEGSAVGYLVDLSSAALRPLDRTDFEARLAGELRVLDRKGSLLVIRREP